MLKKKLEREEKRRQLHRNQRAKVGLPTVSLAGYTSAGQNHVIQQNDRGDQSHWTRYLYYSFYIYWAIRPAGEQSAVK